MVTDAPERVLEICKRKKGHPARVQQSSGKHAESSEGHETLHLDDFSAVQAKIFECELRHFNDLL